MMSEMLKPKKKRRKTKKRRKKVGRPRGYRLKLFEETRIGFFLQHEAPIEYELLKEVTESMKLRYPSADLIEAICYASDDPLFQKSKFWRSLQEYRKYECRPPVARISNAQIELYYIKMRLRKFVS